VPSSIRIVNNNCDSDLDSNNNPDSSCNAESLVNSRALTIETRGILTNLLAHHDNIGARPTDRAAEEVRD
jgi:hypothetical protein